MGTAARGWAAALLFAAVLLGHGLQCGSAADGVVHGVHGGDAAALSVALTAIDAHLSGSAADHGADVSATAPPATHHDAAPATTAGSAPGHWHGLPGHLWAVCLAVLAAGLAILLALAALRQPWPTASPVRLRGLFWPTPPRPPDLFSLCVLRT
ncbi:hypothetical protein [Geodermatophilus sp. SYSU D01176]